MASRTAMGLILQSNRYQMYNVHIASVCHLDFVHMHLCLPRHSYLESLRNLETCSQKKSPPKPPLAFPLRLPTSTNQRSHNTPHICTAVTPMFWAEKSATGSPTFAFWLLPSSLRTHMLLLFSTSCCLVRYQIREMLNWETFESLTYLSIIKASPWPPLHLGHSSLSGGPAQVWPPRRSAAH